MVEWLQDLIERMARAQRERRSKAIHNNSDRHLLCANLPNDLFLIYTIINGDNNGEHDISAARDYSVANGSVPTNDL